MEPLTREFLVNTIPAAAPQDVEEYERLLAERFTVDPDLPKSAQQEAAYQARERRLAELHKKLFPRNVPALP